MKSNLLNFKENFFSWSTVNYFQKSKPEITRLFVIHSMKKTIENFHLFNACSFEILC